MGYHCATCTCQGELGVRQLVGNITWMFSKDGVKGPVCNSLACGGALQYQTKNGSVRAIRPKDEVGHNIGRLVCVACGQDYLLGHEPRVVGEVRTEAEALRDSYAAKGVFI